MPNNIAGSQLVSVLNPDGSLVGSGGGGGSVTVTNFPATQAVSGTVTANAGTGTFRMAPVANDSITGRAQVAAPAAATQIVTVASTTAGLYKVECAVSITGTTVVANDSNNMGIYVNNVLKVVVPYILPGTAGMTAYTEVRSYQFTIGAAQNVEVRSLANAATAGSTYHGSVSITKLD